jgi:outer membrane protein assembly factor BamD
MKLRSAWLLTALLGATILGGCGGLIKEDPILRLSADEALQMGKELMERGKYFRARRYLSHAFEVEPNSRTGREALLLVADAHYLQGGTSNYIQAEARYRDYLNRFPTSQQAAYSQLQIANSLAHRMEKPDRDQSASRDALAAYQELVRLYPTSEYALQADDQIQLVRQNLAEHEFLVGKFYYRVRNFWGAAKRFEFLLENFPEYPERDKIYYFLGVVYNKSRREEEQTKAQEAFDNLRAQFPDSPYIHQIPELQGVDPRAQPRPEETEEEGSETQRAAG